MTADWMLVAALNGAAGLAFIAVGGNIALRLTQTGQWGVNRVSSMFAVLVVACGLGHAGRALLAIGPSIGLFPVTGEAARVVFADWHMWVTDGMTAVAGVFYVVVRFRDWDMVQTAKAFHDYKARRARGVEVHDEVVQNLVEARLALDDGNRERSQALLEEGLDTSKQLISGLHPVQGSDEEAHEATSAGVDVAAMLVGPALLVGLLATPLARAHETGVLEVPAAAASSLWGLASAMNLLMAVAFVLIAIPLWRSVRQGGRWNENPLMLGMALIFSTCALSHLLHFEHAMLPYYAPALGLPGAEEAASFGAWAQVSMSNPFILGIDVATAATAIWYMASRRRQRDVLQGVSLAEDLDQRAVEARQMQDTVVQQLTQARMLIQMNEDEDAQKVLEGAIDEARGVVDHFFDEGPDSAIEGGELVQADG